MKTDLFVKLLKPEW